MAGKGFDISVRSTIELIAAVHIGIFVLIASVLFFSFVGATHSKPAFLALKFAYENPEIAKAVGPPVSARVSMNLSYRYSGSRGEAAFKVKVKGRNGKGNLLMNLEMHGGNWSIKEVVFENRGLNETVEFIEKNGSWVPGEIVKD